MSGLQSSKSFQENTPKNLKLKLSIYKENMKILEQTNKKLFTENIDLQKKLKSELSRKNEIIEELEKKILSQEELLTCHRFSSISPSHSESKSDLFQIISDFKERTTSLSKIQEIQDEFEDIEKIQNGIKLENVSAKKALSKFEDLYPIMHKITSLSQRLLLIVQCLIKGEEVNMNFFVHSPDKAYKTLDVIEHYQEDMKKTKEILENVVETIADRLAEQSGNECNPI